MISARPSSCTIFEMNCCCKLIAPESYGVNSLAFVLWCNSWSSTTSRYAFPIDKEGEACSSEAYSTESRSILSCFSLAHSGTFNSSCGIDQKSWVLEAAELELLWRSCWCDGHVDGFLDNVRPCAIFREMWYSRWGIREAVFDPKFCVIALARGVSACIEQSMRCTSHRWMNLSYKFVVHSEIWSVENRVNFYLIVDRWCWCWRIHLHVDNVPRNQSARSLRNHGRQ